jgi:hypothetical protein
VHSISTVDLVSTHCFKHLKLSFKNILKHWLKTLVDRCHISYMFRIACIHHQRVYTCSWLILWLQLGTLRLCGFRTWQLSHCVHIPVLVPVGGVVIFIRRNNTTPPTGTKTGMYTRWDNCQVMTAHNLNIPNCNHRINQERYMLPDDGYMLSETCRRNDDGPLMFLPVF